MTETHIEFVDSPQRDYAFIYSKVARHVAAADALLIHNNVHAASEELEKALIAIELFETTLVVVNAQSD
jgi:hypothetical protein